MAHALTVQESQGFEGLHDKLVEHGLVIPKELDQKTVGQDLVHELLERELGLLGIVKLTLTHGPEEGVWKSTQVVFLYQYELDGVVFVVCGAWNALV